MLLQCDSRTVDRDRATLEFIQIIPIEHQVLYIGRREKRTVIGAILNGDREAGRTSAHLEAIVKGAILQCRIRIGAQVIVLGSALAELHVLKGCTLDLTVGAPAVQLGISTLDDQFLTAGAVDIERIN